MKLGELDNTLNERLTQERTSLEQAANSELQRLSESLSASVSAALATTEDAIRQRSETLAASLTSSIDRIEERCALLSLTMFKAWIGYAMLALLVTLAVFAGCWFLTSGAQADVRAMRQALADLTQERDTLLNTIKTLEAKTWGIRLHEDKAGRFIVLPATTKPQPGWMFGKNPAIKLD